MKVATMAAEVGAQAVAWKLLVRLTLPATLGLVPATTCLDMVRDRAMKLDADAVIAHPLV